MLRATLLVFVSLLVGCATSNAVRPAALALEQSTTLHVGELAVLHIPSDRGYSPDEINGAWQDVLARVRQSGRDVTFRVRMPGQGVIILSPDVPNGECISCATLHYFVNVVPQE